MIVVKLELWPGGDEQRKRSLGTAFIVNDGTGDARYGNYRVMLGRMRDGTIPWRIGRVFHWNRRGSPWDLLVKAIMAARDPSSDHALRREMVAVARRAVGSQLSMDALTEDGSAYEFVEAEE